MHVPTLHRAQSVAGGTSAALASSPQGCADSRSGLSSFADEELMAVAATQTGQVSVPSWLSSRHASSARTPTIAHVDWAPCPHPLLRSPQVGMRLTFLESENGSICAFFNNAELAREPGAKNDRLNPGDFIIVSLAQYLEDGRCCSLTLFSVGGRQYPFSMPGLSADSSLRAPSVLTPEIVGSKVCGFAMAEDGTYQVESKW